MCVPSRPAANATPTSTSTSTSTIQNKNENENEISKSSSKLSSSWKEERQQQIDALNDRVEKLTKVAIEDSKKSGKPLALEYVHAQQPMTTIVAGAPVYQMRSATLVYLYLMGTSVLIIWGMTKLSFFGTALSMVTIFLGYDFYSGILHVVLDHPSNIALPILGQPCLEFQWHHAIPDDLVRKDFVDVCGDLNVVVLILAVINIFFFRDIQNPSAVAMVIGGMKLWMAYFGQFSHKSAHSFGKSRAPVAEWLQRNGFMISPKDHMAHHKPPHDLDFCLIGICNPIIDLLRNKVTTNNTIWLTAFLIWSVFDILAYVKFVEYVLTIY